MKIQKIRGTYYAWIWRTDHFIMNSGSTHTEAMINTLSALKYELSI